MCSNPVFAITVRCEKKLEHKANFVSQISTFFSVLSFALQGDDGSRLTGLPSDSSSRTLTCRILRSCIARQSSSATLTGGIP